MPVQRGKSSLLAKYGAKLREAAEKHRNDEVDFGNLGELPAGIEGGIAQLQEAKFAQYKKGDMVGEWYFMATGVVREPKEFSGQRIENARTQIGPEPVCDTPKRSRETMDEHIGWIQNELKKLGVSSENLAADDLESAAAAITAAAPYFRFRTWKGEPTKEFPNPRVNHQWNGVCEYSENADRINTSGIDGAVAAPSANGADVAAGNGAGFNEFGDLDSLAQAAQDGDDNAIEQLTKMALDAGISEETVNDAKTWSDVVQLITAAGASEEPSDGETTEGEADADDDTEDNETEEAAGPKTNDPKVGDVFKYHPIDSKTNRPVKKHVQVEVTAIDKAKKTVTLRNLEDNKRTYKGVKFDNLETV